MKIAATIISLILFGHSYASYLGPLHQCTAKLSDDTVINLEIRDNLKATATYQKGKSKQYLGSCQMSPISKINAMDGKTREIKVVFAIGNCDQLDQKKFPVKEEPTFRLKPVSGGYSGLLFIQKNRHPIECRSEKTNIKKWYSLVK